VYMYVINSSLYTHLVLAKGGYSLKEGTRLALLPLGCSERVAACEGGAHANE